MAVASSAPVAPKAAIVSASDRRAPAAPGADRPRLAGYAFPRPCRLTQPAEYAAVFAQRRLVRGRWLTLHLLARPADAGCRLGLVVPKKLLRTAVSRNRVKRLIREAFRQQRASLVTADYVFRLAARPAPRGEPLPIEHLRRDLASILARCRRRAEDGA